MDVINIALVVIVGIQVLLVTMTVLGGRGGAMTKVYFINIFTLAWWASAMFFFRVAAESTILFATNILYVAASFIASSFFVFTYFFPETEVKLTKLKVVAIAIPNLIIVYLLLGDSHGLIIKDAIVNYPHENIIVFGKLYIFYVAYILYYFLYSFYRIFQKYRKETDKQVKLQLLYIFLGYTITGNIAFVSNLLLPWFGFFELNWLGQISTIILATTITYSITKHKLFNSKIVVAELFIFSLWIFILIRTLISDSVKDQLINLVLLLISIVVGIFLMKSVLKEVAQREKIEKLAQDLSQANERLKELDNQKSEFVSLASHQLRGPLTAIRGYTSMILEGDFGVLVPETKDAVEKINKSTQDLVILVSDYLDVSRIEQGRMQYNFSTFDMKDLVSTVVNELKPNIEKANLTLDFDYEKTGEFKVNADMGKIKQVIGNFIDNSVKYTPKGHIHVWITKTSRPTALATGPLPAGTKGKVLVVISDTGVGIAPEVLPRLFEKFTRAPDASKTNIMGTGLGLYVAKKMIEAHNGRVWAESAGAGKGASFFIELDEAA